MHLSINLFDESGKEAKGALAGLDIKNQWLSDSNGYLEAAHTTISSLRKLVHFRKQASINKRAVGKLRRARSWIGSGSLSRQGP